VSGLGRTTFYRHFGDRDELLEAVLAEIVEQARQTTAAAAIDPADPGPSIRRMTSAYLEVAFAYGPLIDSLDGASATLDSALESDRSPTKRFLDAARDLGTIRTDMPRRWQQSVMRSVPLTGIQQVAAGYLTRPEAERLVAGTLSSVLLPERS
jgi:AcrR family transcriptional regulator